MGTRGETTVEIGAALLHHSHLPRNHIYHVIGSCVISSLLIAIHPQSLNTTFHSMHLMSKNNRRVQIQSAFAILDANQSRSYIFVAVCFSCEKLMLLKQSNTTFLD